MKWSSASAPSGWPADRGRPRAPTSVSRKALRQEFVGANREFGPRAHPKLLEYGMEIDFHRPLGDAELLGDLAVAQSAANEADDLAFARRKRRTGRPGEGLL